MRKWITLLMTLLVGCGSYANANTGQVNFEAGYRHDTIDWKHRFPSHDPVEKSTLRFEDLDIFQIALHGRSTIGHNFYVRGSAYWGWILDGDFKRSFKAHFDDSFSNVDEGVHLGFNDHRRSTIDDQYVFGVNAAVGYPFYFCDCTMILAPVIGYSFDEQNVRVENDEGFVFEYGPFAQEDNGHCCRNTFISRWYGPFVGVDFDWRPWNSCFNVWAELEFHWGSFKGKRSHGDSWNHFDGQDRRSHDARAWVFALGVDYDLCNCWTIGLSAKFQDWRANKHHRVCVDEDDYLVGSLCDHRARTNHKWHSYAINVTLGHDF